MATRTHLSGPSSSSMLEDIVIHSLDIRRPLLRHHEVSERRGVLVASDVWTSRFFIGHKLYAGLRATATDADWSAGEGNGVNGPIEALVLAMTGRSTGLEDCKAIEWRWYTSARQLDTAEMSEIRSFGSRSEFVRSREGRTRPRHRGVLRRVACVGHARNLLRRRPCWRHQVRPDIHQWREARVLRQSHLPPDTGNGPSSSNSAYPSPEFGSRLTPRVGPDCHCCDVKGRKRVVKSTRVRVHPPQGLPRREQPTAQDGSNAPGDDPRRA